MTGSQARTLRGSWDAHAEEWIRWVRTPGHDSYEQFHGARFAELLPEAGMLTVDLCGGEGRLWRDLARLGHRLVVLEGSPTLARACAGHEHPLPTVVADAASIPLATGCADLVVAFMALHDVEELGRAVAEAARVLVPGGRLCAAIVHPLNSAGAFEDGGGAAAPFVVRGPYLSEFRFQDEEERDGLTMTFHSVHRPFEAYSRALEAASFVIEAVREVGDPRSEGRWDRVPMFLDVRARRR